MHPRDRNVPYGSGDGLIPSAALETHALFSFVGFVYGSGSGDLNVATHEFDEKDDTLKRTGD